MKLQFRVLKALGTSLLVHVASFSPEDTAWQHSGVLIMSHQQFLHLKNKRIAIEITSDISVNVEIQEPVEASI